MSKSEAFLFRHHILMSDESLMRFAFSDFFVVRRDISNLSKDEVKGIRESSSCTPSLLIEGKVDRIRELFDNIMRRRETPNIDRKCHAQILCSHTHREQTCRIQNRKMCVYKEVTDMTQSIRYASMASASGLRNCVNNHCCLILLAFKD